MKNFYASAIALFALFSISTVTYSQNFCGTQLGDEQKAKLNKYAAERQFDTRKSSSAQFFIPIQFHMVGDDNGNGFYSANQLMQDLCQLNRQYAPVGFYFFLAGDLHYIKSSYYYTGDYSAGYQMMNLNNVDNAVNVYIVEDPAGNCGYYAPSGDGVAVGKKCMGNGTTTLAHEVGHFFSLPHPFDNVNNIKEYVDGSNCSVGGDLFCDTRADFLSYRWSCPYTGNDKDPKGVVYNPDETLYMGYALDACAKRFSNEQMSAMQNDIQSWRTNLINTNVDTSYFTTRVQRTAPMQNVYVMPANAKFAWKKHPEAGWYHLQASTISAFPNPTAIDVIVKDTFYVANLVEGKTYRWRVRPIKPGRTCSEYSDTGVFIASVKAGISEVSDGSLSIYPNPADESGQINIALQTDAKPEITVFSADGRQIDAPVIEKTSDNIYTMNVNGWAKGVYFISIVTGERKYRQKLLLQ